MYATTLPEPTTWTNEALAALSDRDLRLALVRARGFREVANQMAALLRRKAEQAVIEAAGGEKALGPNEAAQKRALILALDAHEPYKQASAIAFRLGAEVEWLEAELDARTEARKIRGLELQERMIVLLEARGHSTIGDVERAAFAALQAA